MADFHRRQNMGTSPLCGLLLAIGLAACHSPPGESRGGLGPDASRAGRNASAVEGVFDLPSIVRSVVQVPANRRVRVLDDVRIEVGGRLELEPGDVVAVANGKGLYVRGGELLAKGTPEARIVFTSLSAKPQPGDWCGVVIDWADLPKRDEKNPWPTSSIEHAVIEFAGRPWTGGGIDERAGGLSIQGYLGSHWHATLAGKLVLSSVEIRDNSLRGFDVRTDAPLEWRGLKFGKNGGVSARIDIDRVGHLRTSPTESVELVGRMEVPVELPRLSSPYVVVDDVHIGSYRGDPLAVLTIPAGTTVKFKAGKGLLIGGYFPGKLIAHGVTFTSAEPKPKAGDWSEIGLWVDSSADLKGDTFEYADGASDGVLPLATSADLQSKIRNCVFRNNAGPAFGATSCTKWQKPALGNVSEGQPLCRRFRRR